MQKLQQYIQHFVNINEKDWEELSSLFTTVNYKKGEHIYGNSEFSDAIYFMTEGIVRSYKLDDEGKDFTWTFHCLDIKSIEHRMLMDVIVLDYISFSHNVPEVFAFEVLADATLMKISKKDMLALYKKNLKWKDFDTRMAKDSYVFMRERAFTLFSKDAKDRLKVLKSYFPGLFFKGISHEYLASYLGVTRQTLNRLKREMEE